MIGIEKSWEYIRNGNLIVFVTPADKDVMESEKRIVQEIKKEKIIGIISKKDINKSMIKIDFFKRNEIPFIEVNLINENEREEIIDFISNHIKMQYNFFDQDSGFICNNRQEEIFKRTEKKLKWIFELINNNYDEIIANELKEILFDFEEFIGHTDNEEVLDSIFSEFCIGK
jgi:tRNA modification GTPase